MRYLFPLALLCASCNPQSGPAGPPGPQGDPGPPGMQGPAGKDGASAKQLHLVVEATGEDLGLFVATNSAVAYNVKIGAVAYYSAQAQFLYPSADCKGAPMLAASALQRPYAVVGPATMLVVTDKPQKMRRLSSLAAGNCINAEIEQDAVPFSDTGVPGKIYAPGDLIVELR